MVDRETLKECHVCLIGYLLKNIKDIDKLSITKDYLKDFSIPVSYTHLTLPTTERV